jgi:uncharacterized protein
MLPPKVAMTDNALIYEYIINFKQNPAVKRFVEVLSYFVYHTFTEFSYYSRLIMHKSIKLLSIFLFLLLSSKTFAVEAPSIYQVEVPVATHSDQLRDEAIKKGFVQVLVKVSGNSHVMEAYPKLKPYLGHADDLVQEFSYTTPTTASSATPYLLVVRFDVDSINKLLKDAGASVWGQNRPSILVWMAYDGPNHPAEVVGSSERAIQTTLNDEAEQRGLPVIFPVMDVTELTQVTPTDVINKTLTVLKPASQRYDSKAILMGHLTQTTAGVTSNWQLLVGDEHWDFNVAGKNLQDVFGSLVNQISDTLAKRYSAVITDVVQTNIILKVTGLKQQSDLALLMKYLQQLTPVANVQLKSVNGDEIILTLNLRGTQQAFVQAVALGSNLKPVASTTPADDSLQYQWTQ